MIGRTRLLQSVQRLTHLRKLPFDYKTMSTANPDRLHPNRLSLKQKLLKNPDFKAFGGWSFSCSPITTQVLGLSGMDFVIVDLEHGPGNVWTAVQELNALEMTGAAGFVRAPWNDLVALKKIMDIGPAGVIIPWVNNAEEAKKAIAAVTYAPKGLRGCAYPRTRSAAYSFDQHYKDSHMDHTLIMLQIESPEAVDNIEEIAKVPGVDMLFLGPRDLSGNMGVLEEFTNPKVVAKIREAERRIIKSGVMLGSVIPGGDNIHDMWKRGYRLIAGAADMAILKSGAEAAVKNAKSKL